MAKTIFAISIVLIAAFIAGFPLLHYGLPPTHDGEYHIIRFYQFDKTLRDGNWYPRWAPDLNNAYGVPLFNYVYPLPNYIASFLHAFSISFIDAFKLNMFIATLVGGVFFYLWTERYWGSIGALVASIVYTFSPYHFVDIYIRGSVGEVWALALFPGFLFFITSFIQKNNDLYGLLTSLSIALIIFSHNILALMFISFGIVYSIILSLKMKINKRQIVHTCFFFLLGLLIATVFWLPALGEIKYVTGLQLSNIKDNFPELYQLLFPSWGSGFSGRISGNELSYQIGITNLLGVFLSIISLFFFKKRKDALFAVVTFFVISFIITFFLMLKNSHFLWEHVPLMHYFQFPWRLLSLEIVITSFLTGSIFGFAEDSKSKWKIGGYITAFLFILFSITITLPYTQPAYYHQREDNYYTNRSNFIDGTNSPGDQFKTIWMKKYQKTKEKIEFSVKNTKIVSSDIKSTEYTYKIDAPNKTEAVVHTAFFPGWTAFIDTKKQPVVVTQDGMFCFSIPKGKHIVSVLFLNTPIRSIAGIISLVATIFTIALCIKYCCVTIKK